MREANEKLPAGRYYGETLRRQAVSVFGLTETIYPRGFQIPYHSHERPYLGLVLKGVHTLKGMGTGSEYVSHPWWCSILQTKCIHSTSLRRQVVYSGLRYATSGWNNSTNVL